MLGLLLLLIKNSRGDSYSQTHLVNGVVYIVLFLIGVVIKLNPLPVISTAGVRAC